MVDLFDRANQEHDKVYKSVKTLAATIDCEMSEQGGKKFAPIVLSP